MTVDDVRARIAEIASLVSDPEAAHSEEDHLHRAVLQAIADRQCGSPYEVAAEALKTYDLDFPRWC